VSTAEQQQAAADDALLQDLAKGQANAFQDLTQDNAPPLLSARMVAGSMEEIVVDQAFLQNAFESLTALQGTLAGTIHALNELEDELSIRQQYQVLATMTEAILETLKDEIGLPSDPGAYDALRETQANLVSAIRKQFDL
jgi:hypothetical protein